MIRDTEATRLAYNKKNISIHIHKVNFTFLYHIIIGSSEWKLFFKCSFEIKMCFQNKYNDIHLTQLYMGKTS